MFNISSFESDSEEETKTNPKKLLSAARKGDLETLRNQLNKEIDIKDFSTAGNPKTGDVFKKLPCPKTPLAWAAYGKHWDCVLAITNKMLELGLTGQYRKDLIYALEKLLSQKNNRPENFQAILTSLLTNKTLITEKILDTAERNGNTERLYSALGTVQNIRIFDHKKINRALETLLTLDKKQIVNFEQTLEKLAKKLLDKKRRISSKTYDLAKQNGYVELYYFVAEHELEYSRFGTINAGDFKLYTLLSVILKNNGMIQELIFSDYRINSYNNRYIRGNLKPFPSYDKIEVLGKSLSILGALAMLCKDYRHPLYSTHNKALHYFLKNLFEPYRLDAENITFLLSNFLRQEQLDLKIIETLLDIASKIKRTMTNPDQKTPFNILKKTDDNLLTKLVNTKNWKLIDKIVKVLAEFNDELEILNNRKGTQLLEIIYANAASQKKHEIVELMLKNELVTDPSPQKNDVKIKVRKVNKSYPGIETGFSESPDHEKESESDEDYNASPKKEEEDEEYTSPHYTKVKKLSFFEDLNSSDNKEVIENALKTSSEEEDDEEESEEEEDDIILSSLDSI